MMRHLPSITILLCLFSPGAFSQTFVLSSATNGQTISTCSGTLYDSNPVGNYGDNQDYTITFYPNSINQSIRLDFAYVELAFNDSLTIYDGPNINAPVLGSFDYLSNNVSVIAAKNANGCLTVRFKSDNALTARGWQATIRCVPPCQAFTGTLASSPAADANGVVTVCLGDQVTLTANMNYPNSGNIYNQSNALSVFKWKPGFANDTSGYNLNTITRKITQHAGYRVDLLVIDSNGCAISQNLRIKVRTAKKPTFSIAQPAPVCAGDTVTLSSPFQMTPGAYIVPPFSGDSLFLPDGIGVTYSDTIRISDFSAGQTLTNLNDFTGVFMNMEHSFLGDLQIKLIAPNGTSVTLKQYPSGSGTFLGEPVDNDLTPNVPGRGYLYGFTPNPTFNTMLSEATLHRHTYTDVLGRVYTNIFYLPAGNYTPATPLSAMVGTPLNGNWVIQIRDNLASDNGFIFNWYLSFAAGLYSNPENYTIPSKSFSWEPAAGVIASAGTTASFSPQVAGIANYTFKVVDSADCYFDTVVQVNVNPVPNKPDLGADKALCPASTLDLTVSGITPGAQYVWNTGATGPFANISQAGTYQVLAINGFGCKARDTVIVIADPGVTVNLGVDTLFCASNPNVLSAATTGTVASYKWINNITNASLPITGSGSYWLEVTSDKGCKSADTINITDNPINSWKAPNDTSICGTGLSVTLSGYPSGTTFTWSDGATGISRNFTGSGIYGITANYRGCLRQDNIDIGIHAIPVVRLGNDTLFCASDPNILRSGITGNIASFTWNTGASTPDLPITTTGIYWLEAVTSFGCKHRDSIDVTANPINSWQTLSDTSICDRTIHTVSLGNYPSGTGFSWYDGSTGPTHDFETAGIYKVTANYIGCLKQDSVAIDVRPLPVIEIGNDTTLCMGFLLPLKVRYPGAAFLWNTGENDSAITVSTSGIYRVEAGLNGCTYSDNITATFIDCNCHVSVPNAFSPNKDGINDLFRVHMECMPKHYRLSIFNRYGQPVFETADIFKGWNGEVKGKKMPVGTYYYILTYYNDGFRRDEMHKGYVVLLN
jgi:gliding motility-associated-like protein